MLAAASQLLAVRSGLSFALQLSDKGRSFWKGKRERREGGSALTRGKCFFNTVYKLLRKLFQPTKSITTTKNSLQSVESREHVNLGNQKPLGDLNVTADLLCGS